MLDKEQFLQKNYKEKSFLPEPWKAIEKENFTIYIN